MKIILSEHALFEAKRRNIEAEQIYSVFKIPHQRLSSKKGRVIFQNKYHDSIMNKEMLLRVIGCEIAGSFHVITAYKTSKIGKYWHGGGE
ncbi:MAG: hypothetical protein HY887_07520 [Deltaproteobacteria bacterium]|nr:hypothetical protein [Deltaproteobacteria bacterium]